MQTSDRHPDNSHKVMLQEDVFCVLCHNRQEVWKQPGLTEEMFICCFSSSASAFHTQCESGSASVLVTLWATVNMKLCLAWQIAQFFFSWYTVWQKQED